MTLVRSCGFVCLFAALGVGTSWAQTGAPAASAGPAPAAASTDPAGQGPASAAANPGTSAGTVPGAPPSGAPAPGAPAAASDGGAYTVRLRSLERNINELKEKVFITKTKLNLLKETVLGGVIGASRAVIKHKNEMGSSFRLIKAVYALDGVQIFSKADDGGTLADTPEFDIYNGAIQPGSHTISVQLTYQGNGFGVFSYVKNYKFNVKSSHSFVAGEGKATVIAVVGYEKGGVTTNMEEKPAIDFRVNLVAPEAAGTAAKK